MQGDCFGIVVDERGRVDDHAGEVAAATRPRHLPGKYIRQCGVVVDIRLYGTLDHGREHGRLRLEGSSVGYGEIDKVGA